MNDWTPEMVEQRLIEAASVLRPVLPMVMRGLPVPREKQLYIVLDTKREAEDAGVAFGRMLNRYTDTPVGQWFIRRCGASNHVRYRLEVIQ